MIIMERKFSLILSRESSPTLSKQMNSETLLSYQTVSMDKTQYIGEKEIKGIEKNVVTFADDSQEEFTEKQLTYLVTEEVTDPSEQRELVLKNTVPEVFEVLKKHNIRYGDLDAVINSIA